MSSERLKGNEYWVVVRFVGYDRENRAGVMEVVDWAKTKDDATQKCSLAIWRANRNTDNMHHKEEVFDVFPRPFKQKPQKGEKFFIPGDFSRKLDVATEKAEILADQDPHRSLREVEEEGRKRS